jgi:preprotein translocase subunit SecD
MDSTPVLTGPDFYEVSPGMRESGEGYVSFQVWPKAAKRLQKYTEVYVDQCIAITVDGKAHRCVPIEDKFGQTFVVNCGSAHENPFELYKLVTGRD